MIIAFVGQKGGSGKSTLAIAVASELALRGANTLLVDADPQQTAVTWHDVATELGVEVPTVVAMSGTLHKPNQLPKLAQAYEHTIVDTPPRLGEVQRSAMAVADVAVLPCGPSAPDAWALAESLKTIDEAKSFRPELHGVIVINKKRSGTAAAKGARDALEATGTPVLKTEIGLRQAYGEALSAGKGPTSYAPKDAAAVEVRALVDELLKLGRKTK